MNNKNNKQKWNPYDMVICDVPDAVLKDAMCQMEHPFFSLNKNRDMNSRRYEHNGNCIEVFPSHIGLVTIYDKDILVYAISQVMAKSREGGQISQNVQLSINQLLKFIGRGTSGRDYEHILEAFKRLRGTTIQTNVKSGDTQITKIFGLIESVDIERKEGFTGRITSVEMKLSDWIFNALKSNEVLTLNRDYFKIKKPIDKRIYELGRKHCGQQKEFSIGLAALHKKCGSSGNVRLFKQALKRIVEANELPDYFVDLDESKNVVTFFNRESWWKRNKDKASTLGILSTTAYESAKKAAPGYDVYYLEREFREWAFKLKDPIFNLDAAFIGFCRKVHKKRATPGIKSVAPAQSY